MAEITQEKIVATERLVTNFYTYEGVVKALNGVSIYIKQGETYGLVGESGCGKSVTVRSMMRIVQEPGAIEGGKILIFFSERDRKRAIDLLSRSEAFMQSLRGDEISMIFQEAGTSLNPVLSIEYQVGEAFLLHRRTELIEESIERLRKDLEKRKGGLKGFWKRFQVGLLHEEYEAVHSAEQREAEIDNRLYEIEDQDTPQARREKAELNRKRETLSESTFRVNFIRRFPLIRRYRNVVHGIVREKVIDLLTKLGVPNPDKIVDAYPHELSGGMQQRIVIAIALACNPRLLIADEPTSNLDVTIQAQILDLIKTLKETTIASVLFITHDLGVVAEICDRVTVMYAGDTCETAYVKDLFRNPLHPYTQGLLKSVPKVEQKEELATIPGIVPNLVDPPSGCRFHPRCPYAMDICKREKPAIHYDEHDPEHSVHCHLYLKGNEQKS